MDESRARKLFQVDTISGSNQEQVTSEMRLLLALVETHKDLDRDFLSLCLSWILSILDLHSIYTVSAGTSAELGITLQASQIVIRPVKVLLTSLAPEHKAQIQGLCLDVFRQVMGQLNKLDTFSLWSVLLPKSSLCPFKLSISDLLVQSGGGSGGPSHSWLQLKVLDILNYFVETSGSFFMFVESSKGKRKSTMSFTPLYHGLSVGLEETHYLLTRSIQKSRDLGYVTAATRCLSGLMKKCPYNKMEDRVLASVYEIAHSLIGWSNPVAQIAGLNLFVPLLSAHSDSPPAQDSAICRLLLDVAFPDQRAFVDNNARYVALQNLGQISNLNIAAVEANLDHLGQTIDSVFSEKDSSIILHTLRFLKLLAKNEPREQPQRPGPPFLRLWNGLLKPKYMQLIEQREEHCLRAALCDTLSDIGEEVHQRLPSEKRHLIVTYLLTHCYDPVVSVRTSSFRGIGMILGFQSSQDIQFITDCTEKIMTILEPSTHKSILMSATWALSNLCDALIVLRREDSELYFEYPQHYILKLIELCTGYIKDTNSHLCIKVNCLRSIGCLLLCCESISVSDETDTEVGEVLENGIKCIIDCIKEHSSMKIRWNACYAASKVVLNENLKKYVNRVVVAIVSALKTCKNYKVRINALSVLLNVDSRVALGDEYTGLILAILEGIDGLNALEDLDETMHKLDLVESSCLALCHVALLSTGEDLKAISAQVSNDQVERIEHMLVNARKRISPEKAGVFMEAYTYTREKKLHEEAFGSVFKTLAE